VTLTKTPLEQFLTERLNELNLSLRAFAIRIGVSNVFVVRVKSGQALFPPGQFSAWCKGLELNEVEQEEFLRLTLISQSPPELRAFIARLEIKLKKQK
jgi:hypothetical protein